MPLRLRWWPISIATSGRLGMPSAIWSVEAGQWPIAGENKWQKGMAVFCKPFTTATVRYFDHSQLPEARQWIEAESA